MDEDMEALSQLRPPPQPTPFARTEPGVGAMCNPSNTSTEDAVVHKTPADTHAATQPATHSAAANKQQKDTTTTTTTATASTSNGGSSAVNVAAAAAATTAARLPAASSYTPCSSARSLSVAEPQGSLASASDVVGGISHADRPNLLSARASASAAASSVGSSSARSAGQPAMDSARRMAIKCRVESDAEARQRRMLEQSEARAWGQLLQQHMGKCNSAGSRGSGGGGGARTQQQEQQPHQPQRVSGTDEGSSGSKGRAASQPQRTQLTAPATKTTNAGEAQAKGTDTTSAAAAAGSRREAGQGRLVLQNSPRYGNTRPAAGRAARSAEPVSTQAQGQQQQQHDDHTTSNSSTMAAAAEQRDVYAEAATPQQTTPQAPQQDAQQQQQQQQEKRKKMGEQTATAAATHALPQPAAASSSVSSPLTSPPQPALRTTGLPPRSPRSLNPNTASKTSSNNNMKDATSNHNHSTITAATAEKDAVVADGDTMPSPVVQPMSATATAGAAEVVTISNNGHTTATTPAANAHTSAAAAAAEKTKEPSTALSSSSVSSALYSVDDTTRLARLEREKSLLQAALAQAAATAQEAAGRLESVQHAHQAALAATTQRLHDQARELERAQEEAAVVRRRAEEEQAALQKALACEQQVVQALRAELQQSQEKAEVAAAQQQQQQQQHYASSDAGTQASHSNDAEKKKEEEDRLRMQQQQQGEMQAKEEELRSALASIARLQNDLLKQHSVHEAQVRQLRAEHAKAMVALQATTLATANKKKEEEEEEATRTSNELDELQHALQQSLESTAELQEENERLRAQHGEELSALEARLRERHSAALQRVEEEMQGVFERAVRAERQLGVREEELRRAEKEVSAVWRKVESVTRELQELRRQREEEQAAALTLQQTQALRWEQQRASSEARHSVEGSALRGRVEQLEEALCEMQAALDAKQAELEAVVQKQQQRQQKEKEEKAADHAKTPQQDEEDAAAEGQGVKGEAGGRQRSHSTHNNKEGRTNNAATAGSSSSTDDVRVVALERRVAELQRALQAAQQQHQQTQAQRHSASPGTPLRASATLPMSGTEAHTADEDGSNTNNKNKKTAAFVVGNAEGVHASDMAQDADHVTPDKAHSITPATPTPPLQQQQLQLTQDTSAACAEDTSTSSNKKSVRREAQSAAAMTRDAEAAEAAALPSPLPTYHAHHTDDDYDGGGVQQREEGEDGVQEAMQQQQQQREEEDQQQRLRSCSLSTYYQHNTTNPAFPLGPYAVAAQNNNYYYSGGAESDTQSRRSTASQRAARARRLRSPHRLDTRYFDPTRFSLSLGAGLTGSHDNAYNHNSAGGVHTITQLVDASAYSPEGDAGRHAVLQEERSDAGALLLVPPTTQAEGQSAGRPLPLMRTQPLLSQPTQASGLPGYHHTSAMPQHVITRAVQSSSNNNKNANNHMVSHPTGTASSSAAAAGMPHTLARQPVPVTQPPQPSQEEGGGAPRHTQAVMLAGATGSKGDKEGAGRANDGSAMTWSPALFPPPPQEQSHTKATYTMTEEEMGASPQSRRVVQELPHVLPYSTSMPSTQPATTHNNINASAAAGAGSQAGEAADRARRYSQRGVLHSPSHPLPPSSVAGAVARPASQLSAMMAYDDGVMRSVSHATSQHTTNTASASASASAAVLVIAGSRFALPSSCELRFSLSAGRLLLSRHGRRLERLLFLPRHADTLSASALGSVNHVLYAGACGRSNRSRCRADSLPLQLYEEGRRGGAGQVQQQQPQRTAFSSSSAAMRSLLGWQESGGEAEGGRATMLAAGAGSNEEDGGNKAHGWGVPRAASLRIHPTGRGSSNNPHTREEEEEGVGSEAVQAHTVASAMTASNNNNNNNNAAAAASVAADYRDPRVFRFTIRLSGHCEDVLIGFADRHLPLENCAGARNSRRYTKCYYLHIAAGTLYCPGQGKMLGVPYAGWAAAVYAFARSVSSFSPPRATVAATAAAGGAGQQQQQQYVTVRRPSAASALLAEQQQQQHYVMRSPSAAQDHTTTPSGIAAAAAATRPSLISPIVDESASARLTRNTFAISDTTARRRMSHPSNHSLSAAAAAASDAGRVRADKGEVEGQQQQLQQQADANAASAAMMSVAVTDGDEISCVLHLDTREIGYEYNGITCGVAFRDVDLTASLYPAVEVNSSGACIDLL